jgi:hypothetical protein
MNVAFSSNHARSENTYAMDILKTTYLSHHVLESEISEQARSAVVLGVQGRDAVPRERDAASISGVPSRKVDFY